MSSLSGTSQCNGCELLAEQDLVAMVLEALAVGLALNFRGVFHRAFDGADFWMRSTAPLSPMPGAPGMLSTVSPLSARRSMICLGRTPMNFSTSSSSYHWSFFMGLSMRT